MTVFYHFPLYFETGFLTAARTHQFVQTGWALSPRIPYPRVTRARMTGAWLLHRYQMSVPSSSCLCAKRFNDEAIFPAPFLHSYDSSPTRTPSPFLYLRCTLDKVCQTLSCFAFFVFWMVPTTVFATRKGSIFCWLGPFAWVEGSHLQELPLGELASEREEGSGA